MAHQVHLGVTDLIKHVPQVVFGADPGGHGVAEEDEVLGAEEVVRGETRGLLTDPNDRQPAAATSSLTHLHDTGGVDADHHADSPEGRVLLLVVSDVSQRRAPRF